MKRSGGIAPASGDTLEDEADIRGAAGLEGNKIPQDGMARTDSRIAATASGVSHSTTFQSDSMSSMIDCLGPFLQASLE